MRDRSYWIELYGMRGPDFVNGVKAGIEAYAYGIGGTLHVGEKAEGTLEEALKEVDAAFETEKEDQ